MKKKRAQKNKKVSKASKVGNHVTSNKVTRLPIKKDKNNKKESIISRIDRFFKEAKTEILKVKWPSQKELIASTIAVIIFSLVIAFFLGIVDIGIIKLLKIIIR